MMQRQHPNLSADISYRHPYYNRRIPVNEQSVADERGTLKPEWKALFEQFPDRFMIGTDMQGAGFSPGKGFSATSGFATRFAQLVPQVALQRDSSLRSE